MGAQTAVTTTTGAAAILEGVGGGTSAARGAEIHDFVREHRFGSCLELGFAHGVGTAYIASALEANSHGHLTSVDTLHAHDRRPAARELVDAAGLAHRVDLRYEDTSYTWFLHDRLREQLREDLTFEPLYDFVFLDGAHTWDADGLAVTLVEKLLKPGGWLLLDDLDWYADAESYADMNDYQRSFAQVGEIFELLVKANPVFDEIRTDGHWGWIRKTTVETPQVRTIVQHDVVGAVRELSRLARRKLKR